MSTHKDLLDKLEEVVSELDFRLNDGHCFNITEVDRFRFLSENIQGIMDSLLDKQVV